jgi:integrase
MTIKTNLEVWITLSEASRQTGKTTASLRAMCLRGTIPSQKQNSQGRLVWMVLANQAMTTNYPDRKYDQVIADWLAELAAGLYCKKPHAPTTLQSRKDGLATVWRYSGQNPSMTNLVPETLAKAIMAVPIDHEKRRCRFATKEIAWKAFISLGKYLVRQGLWPKHYLEQLKELKPRRLYPERRTILSKTGLKQYQAAIKTSYPFRTSYQREMAAVLVALMAFAGLRRAEALDLTVDDIDWDNRLLHIRCGKGGKSSHVPISAELHPVLALWVKNTRKKSHNRNVLLKKDDSLFSKWAVKSLMYRLVKHTGHDITPHGLRRTFATLMISSGADIMQVKTWLRHESIETTRKYIINDNAASNAFLQNWTLN